MDLVAQPPVHRAAGGPVVAHFGLTVVDLDAATAFFEEVLGMQPLERVDLDEEFSVGVTGVRGAVLSVAFLQATGLTVELLEYVAGPPAARAAALRPCDPGAAHLALYVESIDPLVEQAREHGWLLAGQVQPIRIGPRAGGRAAYLSDSSGAVIELVERPL